MRPPRRQIPFLAAGLVAFAAAAAHAAEARYDLAVLEQRTPPTIRQYAETEVPLVLRNDGSEPWMPGSFFVSYHWLAPSGRVVLRDGARTPLPRRVARGETVRLVARLAAPPRAGPLRLQWDVVHESVTWIAEVDPTPPPALPVTVVAALPRYAFTVVESEPVRVLRAGTTRRVRLVVRNDGTEGWEAGKAISLSYHLSARGARKELFDGPRAAIAGTVPRGASVPVVIDVRAPDAAGAWHLQWDLVREGVLWFSQADPTPDRQRLVLVVPAWGPLATPLAAALLCAAAALAARRAKTPYLLLGVASVADLLALGATPPWRGAARGKNLLMIQVESMQNFVLHLKIDGQKVTPNLDRWAGAEALWFSGCTDQTSPAAARSRRGAASTRSLSSHSPSTAAATAPAALASSSRSPSTSSSTTCRRR